MAELEGGKEMCCFGTTDWFLYTPVNHLSGARCSNLIGISNRIITSEGCRLITRGQKPPAWENFPSRLHFPVLAISLPQRTMLLSVQVIPKGPVFYVPLRTTMLSYQLSEHSLWANIAGGNLKIKEANRKFHLFELWFLSERVMKFPSWADYNFLKYRSTFVKRECERQSHSLPTLSCFSVRSAPACCLRFRCSPWYQRISPLHHEFRKPLAPSKPCRFFCEPPVKPKNLTED